MPRKTHICPTCSQVFKKKSQLKRHGKTTQHLGFSCPIKWCKKHFDLETGLQSHFTAKHGIGATTENTVEDTGWACKPCKQVYYNEADLKQHYIDEPSHPRCPHCLEAFRDLSRMLLHVRMEHPNFVPYTAVARTMSFTTDKESATATCTPFICNPCSRYYRSNAELHEHYKGHHPTCAPCDEGFEDEEAYDAHFALKHMSIPVRGYPLANHSPSVSFACFAGSATPAERGEELHEKDIVLRSPQSDREVIYLEGALESAPVPFRDDAFDSTFTEERPASCPPKLESGSLESSVHSPLISSVSSLWTSVDLPNDDWETAADNIGSPSENADRDQHSSSQRSTETAQEDTTRPSAGPSPMCSSQSFRLKCQMCSQEPTEPTITICGHLFCAVCILEALTQTSRCPECHKVMLIGLSP